MGAVAEAEEWFVLGGGVEPAGAVVGAADGAVSEVRVTALVPIELDSVLEGQLEVAEDVGEAGGV